MTGVLPRRPQVLDRSGLGDWLHPSSKTNQPPRPSPCSYPRPGLLLLHLDRAIVALDRPARTQLADPAAQVQQVLDPRDHVLHLEPFGHQVAHAGQRPPQFLPPGDAAARPPALPAAAHPADTTPPAPGEACRRRFDRSLTRSSAEIAEADTCCSNPGPLSVGQASGRQPTGRQRHT
jgi:hypothetical protein